MESLNKKKISLNGMQGNDTENFNCLFDGFRCTRSLLFSIRRKILSHIEKESSVSVLQGENTEVRIGRSNINWVV